MSPVPFGWGDYTDSSSGSLEHLHCAESPVPFGWGDYTDKTHSYAPSSTMPGLQCLSAGGTIRTVEGAVGPYSPPSRLQCLSAGGTIRTR